MAKKPHYVDIIHAIKVANMGFFLYLCISKEHLIYTLWQ